MKRTRRCRPLFLAAWIGFLVLSCSRKQDMPQTISYSLETAKVVSHATSGLISTQDPIRVRFVEAVVNESGIGSEASEKLFSFTPKIRGKAVWEDGQTLEFRPDKSLKPRQEYSGRLDMARLFPAAKNVEPLEFKFTAAGNELISVSGDFKPKDIRNPGIVFYEGITEFSDPVEMDRIKESGQFLVNSKRIVLTWKGEEKKYTCQSDPLARNDNDRTCSFRLDRKPLDIPNDYEKEFVLPALSEMAVTGIRLGESGQETRFTVSFSDELDPAKDITGLIAVEPPVAFKTTAAGRDVHLSGKFGFEKEYTIRVRPGIRSKWGTVLREETSKTFKIEDIKPQLRFANDGVFLPSSNEQKIRFQTVNVKAVRVNVKKVFENNLGQFLQTEELSAVRNRNQSFQYWEIDRIGVDVANDRLEIGDAKNIWLQHELDLKKLIQPGEKGLFLLNLSFERQDMLYGKAGIGEDQNNQRWGYGEEYYSNPYSPGYLYRHGQIFKTIILSDIGLTCKKGHEKVTVFATDLLNASPLPDVLVTLRTYQNQILAQKKTDSKGTAGFEGVREKVFFVEAEKNGQRSAVKPDEMAWNLSGFDTGGEDVQLDGLRVFIYTERGVYRPGDEIHVCLIARNPNESFPDGHPVTLKWYNPKNQKMLEKNQRNGKDGFFHFALQTQPEDPTGNWRAEFEVGSKTFTHVVKVETVVPNKLKVLIELEKNRLSAADKRFRIHLKSAYLFGNPASGHEAQVEVQFKSDIKVFSAYPDFLFTNETLDYLPIDQVVFSGSLNESGEAWAEWPLPPKQTVPSALLAVVKAKVMEKGGRPNLNETSISVDVYSRYVGLKRPDVRWGAAQVGSAMAIPVVLVDVDGNPVRGKVLRYKIYRNRQMW